VLKCVHFCVYKFGCYSNSLCPLKIFISIFEFVDPEYPTINANIVFIFCTELKSVQFCLFLPNFGCYGNSLGSVENLGNIFEFNNPVYVLTVHAKKNLDFLQGIEICAILANFCPNLYVMATLFNSLENSGSKFEFTKPVKPYYTCEKFLYFLQGIEIFLQFWLIFV